MQKSSINKEDLDKADVGGGFLSGALISLGISVEEVILSPFLGGLKGFGLIVLFSSIIMLIYSIIHLMILRGRLFGLLIFASSFISGILIFIYINPVNYFTLISGIIFLFISIVAAKISKLHNF